MARELHVLSAGAAKAVVLGLQPAFERVHDVTLRTTFGAVGAMREKWAAGAPCDVLILSAALLDPMIARGDLRGDSRTSMGTVGTGVAVRAGAPLPALANAEELAATFVAATSLYLPDPERATAGIHCVDVLRRLGILETMRPRLRPFANGAVAMAELAGCANEAQPLGCTQVTEILYTPGVRLVGRLPHGYDLNTEYAAAVTARAGDASIAAQFVVQLGSAETLAARRAGGFDA